MIAQDARIDPQEEEVILRLGDILPRVPHHLLKPGPHDMAKQLRFSVDELAEKISRGRASVPYEKLAAACPDVFVKVDGQHAEPEIQLPLQKLLEQVGMIAPKPPAPNGIPSEAVEKAREEASRIIETAAPTREPAAEEVSVEKPATMARRILGLFTKPNVNKSQHVAVESAADKTTPKEEKENIADSTPKAEEKPAPAPARIPAKPASTTAIPDGFISLRLLPIFRLLPAEVVRSGGVPAEDVRVAIPLAAIESQLASGHVEIPLEDFTKALPDDLKPAIVPTAGVNAWIPLDEIFQSLPPDHMFFMPLLEPEPPATETDPQTENRAAEPQPAPAAPPKPQAEATPEAATELVPQPAPQQTPEPDPANRPPDESVAAIPPASHNPPPPEPEPNAEPPAPDPSPPPRAPWMRGFQVPPPRLFGAVSTPPQSPSEPAPPTEPLSAAPTPEARRTADFLASQPGIFAAAAFVQGAVFASADFPRKPDLDALRDFMGIVVHHAQESGQRLGWNRVLTLACDQFYATAVVRDAHFLVALHHDRMLPPLAHDALVGAAEDLGNAPDDPKG